MTTVEEFLGAGDGGVYALGRRLHGAFGGAFGGAVAAAVVHAARQAVPGRRPFSLHCTFARALTTPSCRAVTDVVQAGRTTTTVAIDLLDGEGRTATRATVTLADPAALHPFDHAGALDPPALQPYDAGTPMRMPAGVEAPIVEVLGPRLVGMPSGGYATAMRVPFDPAGAPAEAACLAADLCVGAPVGAVLYDRWVPHPNPDLSLRFVSHDPGPVLTGVARLARVEGGVAATAVEVWGDGGAPVAIGLSSAVLLRAEG